MKKDFQYFLVDDLGRSYYEDTDGSVKVSGQPVPLRSTPDGWQEASIKYARSNSKPGMFRSFTIPLKAVRDGAKILKSIFYTGLVQAVVNLVILKLNRVSDVHEEYFIGTPDLSQFSDEQEGVVVQVMEGGLSQLIKASEDTIYELPINVPEAVNINFDGIEMFSQLSALNYKDYIQSGGDLVPNVRYNSFTNIGMILSNNTETQYPSLVFNQNTQYQDSGNPNIAEAFSDQWFFKAYDNCTLKIKSGKLQFNIAGLTHIYVRFYLQNESTGISRGVNIYDAPSDGRSHDLTINLSGEYEIKAGERGWFYTQMDWVGDGHSIGFAWPPLEDPDGVNEIVFEYNYRKAPTVVKALRPRYVFDQLITKITSGRYKTKSDFLDSIPDFPITSGDGLRGFEGAVVKTSLNQLINSFNVPFNIGFGITTNEPVPRAIIERRKYFYNDNYLVDLGEVANCKISPALDYYFSDLKFGWPNQDLNDVNGRYEFNTSFAWKTPITRVSKTYEVVSSYRADCFGAEISRINLANKKTTDSSSDNDTFIINIEKTPVNGLYNLNRPGIDTITGVPSPATVFNVLLSPGRCLRAHGNMIRTGLYTLEGRKLVFQTCDKNPDFVSSVNGATVVEKADITIGSLESPLFLPVNFEFETRVPLNIKTLVETDPYGKMKFAWKGTPLYQYIIECSQVPALNPSQTFKGLCAPETDLKKLINV